MVKMKLSRIERLAGVFLFFAFFGFAAFVALLCVKQAWFEKKTAYFTYVNSAEGLREGADVQMTGLKVGKVESIDLTEDQRIKVKFSVQERYSTKIKKDASLYLVRPFVIGEKQIEVNPGSNAAETLLAESEIKSLEVFDLMSVLSGKNLNSYAENISLAFGNLTTLLKSLTSEKRTRSIVRTFDRIEPLMKNVDVMVTEFAKLGGQLNRDEKVEKLVKNLNQLTEDFQGLGATIKKMGPQMPDTTARAMEALNETVIVLKALQKSFLLRSNVEAVREEEKRRMPAQDASKP